MPIEELIERYGGAGVIVNRALASMRKGGSGKVLSPVIRAKPQLLSEDDGEGFVASQSREPAAEVDSSDKEPCVSSAKDKICVSLADSISNGFCKEDGDDVKSSVDAVAENDSGSVVDTTDEAVSPLQKNGTAPAAVCDSSKDECVSEGGVHSSVTESGTSGSAACNDAAGSCADNEPGPSSSTSEVRN